MSKRTLLDQVEFVLATYPETRNSDITLTLQLWEVYYPQFLHKDNGGATIINARDLFDLPREDNIKRVRAKFQNEQQKYLPTSIDVLINRAKASKEWRQLLGYQPLWTPQHWSVAVKKFLEPKQFSLV
jgi:hypothetical protein